MKPRICSEADCSDVLIKIVGPFDNGSGCGLHAQILQHFKNPRQNIIVDLSQVTRIDSAGIAILLECLNRSRVHRIRFRITGISQSIKNILELVRLSSVFDELELKTNPLSEFPRSPSSLGRRETEYESGLQKWKGKPP